MAIFHSYVKLPEGRTWNKWKANKECTQQCPFWSKWKGPVTGIRYLIIDQPLGKGHLWLDQHSLNLCFIESSWMLHDLSYLVRSSIYELPQLLWIFAFSGGLRICAHLRTSQRCPWQEPFSCNLHTASHRSIQTCKKTATYLQQTCNIPPVFVVFVIEKSCDLSWRTPERRRAWLPYFRPRGRWVDGSMGRCSDLNRWT